MRNLSSVVIGAAVVMVIGVATGRAAQVPTPAPIVRAGQQNLLEVVRAFMVQDSWRPTQIEGQPTLRAIFKGSEQKWDVFVLVREAARQVIVYSVLPLNTSEARRPAMAEFITRANYGLHCGNFEMDYSDGEVRFKTSIDVEGGTLTETMIKNLLDANVTTTNNYINGSIKVAFVGVAPEAAIQEIEGGK